MLGFLSKSWSSSIIYNIKNCEFPYKLVPMSYRTSFLRGLWRSGETRMDRHVDREIHRYVTLIINTILHQILEGLSSMKSTLFNCRIYFKHIFSSRSVYFREISRFSTVEHTSNTFSLPVVYIFEESRAFQLPIYFKHHFSSSSVYFRGISRFSIIFCDFCLEILEEESLLRLKEILLNFEKVLADLAPNTTHPGRRRSRGCFEFESYFLQNSS